jgi:hypothetical protein
LGTYAWWTHRSPQPATEIFRGVTYGCDRLDGAGGSGLMHWVRVDLTAPGVELRLTPLDADAVAQGWEYRTRYTSGFVSRNHLAVAINGTLFACSSRVPCPGTLARSSGTVVADHVVNHVDPNSYLLWFDDGLRPRFEIDKPPPRGALARARWAIGGGGPNLIRGRVNPGNTADAPLDGRTAIGIDAQRRLLVWGVFDNASTRRATQELRRLGATDGTLLDGGSSSEMAIGEGARGVRPGSLIGAWVPVATHFGVKAERLR